MFEPSPRYLDLRSTSRRSVSWTCLTLLAPPDCAGGSLDRSRFVSWWPLPFFFCKKFVPKCQVRSRTNKNNKLSPEREPLTVAWQLRHCNHQSRVQGLPLTLYSFFCQSTLFYFILFPVCVRASMCLRYNVIVFCLCFFCFPFLRSTRIGYWSNVNVLLCMHITQDTACCLWYCYCCPCCASCC